MEIVDFRSLQIKNMAGEMVVEEIDMKRLARAVAEGLPYPVQDPEGEVELREQDRFFEAT